MVDNESPIKVVHDNLCFNTTYFSKNILNKNEFRSDLICAKEYLVIFFDLMVYGYFVIT